MGSKIKNIQPKIDLSSLNKTKQRIGEERVMNNGMKAVIVAYRSSHDIDVQFEDGTVKEMVRYSCFLNGNVEHPLHKTTRRRVIISRVGEERVMNNGMKAVIIAYRNSHDIDVQFEDGMVREKVQYERFSKGRLRHSFSRKES